MKNVLKINKIIIYIYMSVFNRNRYIALALMMITSLIGWYTILLLTNDFDSDNLPVPNDDQVIGLVIGLFSTLVWWFQRCYQVKVRS